VSASTTCLHLLLSASPAVLARCLALAEAGDTLYFADAGVVHLLEDVQGLAPQGCPVVFAAPCLAARGLGPAARAVGALAVDDAGFAELLRRHARCLSWT